MHKRFDPELYIANDALAKENVLKILDKRKYTMQVNPKKRGVDLHIFHKGKHVLNIETEIKRVWKKKNFEYETVQIPERKNKFANLKIPTLFVMFNADQSSYLVIKDKDLIKSPLVEVPNKYMFKGEYFYQVPLKKVNFNDINNVIKEILDDN